MYKILIVDDEKIVREGIEHIIEWTKLGFDFAGSYDNGTDAAAAVDKEHPAVVITDICMPFGDGLDLTEFIAERHPETKVLLLTGFDEFEYAQRAVKLGAYDYVLKPITAEELSALLVRVRGDLDKEKKKADEVLEMSRALADTRETRIRGLTKKLAVSRGTADKLAPERIERDLHEAGIQLPDGPGVVLAAAFDPEDSPPTLPPLTSVLPNLGVDAAAFEDHEARTIVILPASGEDRTLRFAAQLATRVVSEVAARVGTSVTVAVGGKFESVDEFPRVYLRAIVSLDYRFVIGGGCVIDTTVVPAAAFDPDSDQKVSEAEWSPRFLEGVASLSRSLLACDVGETTRSVRLLFDEIRSGFVSRQQFDLQIHAILVRVNDFREELGEEPVALEEFTRLHTLDAVQSRFLQVCASLIEAQTKVRETYTGSKSREAVLFIKRYYNDPSLSLRRICTELGVSASHFSSLFKSYTGKTFVEYLTEVRVDRAKNLLKTTDLLSYEIASRVGYDDQRYFCTIFKKTTGRSPIEFRREATGVGATQDG